MSAYALVDGTNVVQTVAQWDGNVNTWQPPAGITPMLITAINAPNGCAPGFTFNGTIFVFGQLPSQILSTQIAGDLNNLKGIPAVLRNQASLAASTTVTSGNVVAVVQTVVNDLAIFCARLADFIEGLGYGS